MQTVINPVEREKLLAELTPERFLRRTNKGDNEIFIVDARCAPNVMREIGRLREIAFRNDGGGTGKDCDIDYFDTMENPCRQLMVWNPQKCEIIGGYRFIHGKNVRMREDGQPDLATSHMFHFSEEFLHNYLPYTIELGRSFVTLEYQSSKAGSKALYALDNLWDGLGALTVNNPDIKYLFGKMTMYPTYDTDCRNMLLYFLDKHFGDRQGLVAPINPLKTDIDYERMGRMFSGNCFKDDYKVLNHAIRARGLNIPPLVNAYMSLSPTMKMFGTAVNYEFGNVEESGIFIIINDIFEAKKSRHISTYNKT